MCEREKTLREKGYVCEREREKSKHMIKVEEETVKNRLYNIGI